MPKVTFVKSARRALPQYNIAVGDSYYHWGTKSGSRFVKRYSKTRPTRSQLTNSDFLGQLYEIYDAQIPYCETPDDLREAAQALRDLGEEQRGKYDNMPEGLQQGETGQRLEGRADGCGEAADEIDAAADNWETKLTDDELTEEDEAAYNEAVRAYKQLEDSEPDPDDYNDDDDGRDEFADEHAEWQGKFDDAEEPEEKDFAALRAEAKEEALCEAADTEGECDPY